MALFKIRKSAQKGVDGSTAAVPPAQSIELMRRRAKHRLIGAVVLVLAGVVGFPLLFDSQPRPVMVDIPIEIPDKAKVKPLVMPPSLESVTPTAPEPAASAAVPLEAKPAPLPVISPVATPLPAATPAPLPKPVAKVDEGVRAAALLAGQESPAAGVATARFVVQVGAFSDAAKLREVRQKLERAGLKTYTQVVDGKDGKRTRVRVGPFTSQDEADKAASHIKSLALAASVLKM